MMGRTYLRPGHQGPSCDLNLIFVVSDGSENGFRILYDIDTFDIPLEVMYLIDRAIRLTDPWYMGDSDKSDGNGVSPKSRCIPSPSPFPLQ